MSEQSAAPAAKPKGIDFSKLNASIDEITKRTAQLIERTHIGNVLTFAASVENQLRSALDSHRTVKSKKMTEKLYDASGPLATFSAKIKIAHAFGIISPELAAELDKIRSIRNAFAHTDRVISFQTPEITEAVSRLSVTADGKSSEQVFYEACNRALRDLSAAAQKRNPFARLVDATAEQGEGDTA